LKVELKGRMKVKLFIIGNTVYQELQRLEVKRKTSLESAIVTECFMMSGDTQE